MKYIVLVVAIIVSFSGCSNTPESVVENMFDAMQKGDYVKFVHNTRDPLTFGLTIRTLNECKIEMEKLKDVDIDEMSECFAKVYKYLDLRKIEVQQVSSDRIDAKARYIFNNKPIVDDFVLKQFDGEWKVYNYVRELHMDKYRELETNSKD